MNSNKGFTLIELLVVVAIIGILSSVVLASLNTARTKGKAAAVQASMTSLRAQAELGVGSAGTYLIDLCNQPGTTTGGLQTLLNATTATGGTAMACGQNTAIGVAPSAWGAEITLPTGTFFCVDSTGFSGASTIANDITTGASSANIICNNLTTS